MHRWVLRACVILVVGIVVASPVARAAAGADMANQLVVLGLRPTTSANGPTDLRRLAEAQKSRSLIDSLLQLVSGQSVVGHDDLRQLLGDSYMVDLFDCADRLDCIGARLVQLRRAGYATAVYGTYWVDRDTYHFQLFTFSLVTNKELKRSVFDLAAAQLEDSAAWRPEIEKLFTNRGRVTIASNVASYECRLDGAPCNTEPDGHSLVVLAGEHVIELSKPGYKPSTRVVTVAEASAQQLAFGLEPLPIQAPSASRNDLGTPVVNDASAPGLTPIGQLSFTVVAQPYDTTDNVNNPVPPPGTPKHWHAGVIQNVSYAGASFNDTKRGNWRFGAFALVGLFSNHKLRLPIVGVSIVNSTAGLTVQAGRQFVPTVNVTQPGIFVGFATGFGQFAYAFDGVKVSKSFGHVIADLAIGRPEGFLEGDAPPLSVGYDSYDVEYRLAYLAPEHASVLYGAKIPLTVALSGAVGEHRVGVGETVPTGAATPALETLPTWVFSAETILPVGPFVLSGAGYFGQGAGYYGGAISQLDRVAPMTGDHRLLRSWGGWGQLSLPIDRWEFMAVLGQDKVYKDLAFGIDAHGATNSITWNRASVLIGTYQLSKRMRVGEELHYFQTAYTIGTTSYVGSMTSIWFKL